MLIRLGGAHTRLIVTKQKGGQAHRIRIGRRVLKTLAGILAGAGIGFQGRYNAPYGKDEFGAMPARMCEPGRTRTGRQSCGVTPAGPPGHDDRLPCGVALPEAAAAGIGPPAGYNLKHWLADHVYSAVMHNTTGQEKCRRSLR